MRDALKGISIFSALAAILLTGCGDSLESQWLVRRPRIVSISADPPETEPGSDVTFHVLAHDPESRTLRYRWRVCISAQRVLRNANIPANLPGEDRCEETQITDVPSFVVGGELTDRVAGLLEAIPDAAGFGGSVLSRIIDTAGLAYDVEVDVLVGDEVIARGTKLGAITRRATPTTNPPPISFRIGTSEWVDPRDNAIGSFECVPRDDTRPTIERASEVTLIPGVNGDCVSDQTNTCTESWLETYPVFDYTGNVRMGSENAYYGWLVSDGTLERANSRPPNRVTRYRAPDRSGSVRIWLVTRDGHLGERACYVDVDVIDTAP